MTEPRDIRDDLEPGTPDDVVRLAEHLLDARPLPSPAFRGQLRRRLEARSHRVQPPALIRARIARFATAGTLLLLVGTLSAAGAGPLG
jgi:hypothetical protein